MKNSKKMSLLIATTFAAATVWTVVNNVLYGRAHLRAEDPFMLAFWLFAMTRAYRFGKGESPFPRLKSWLDESPGLTNAEYAAAVAAKKAAAAAAASANADPEPTESEEDPPEKNQTEEPPPAPIAEPEETPHPAEEDLEEESPRPDESEDEHEEEEQTESEPEPELDDLM